MTDCAAGEDVDELDAVEVVEGGLVAGTEPADGPASPAGGYEHRHGDEDCNDADIPTRGRNARGWESSTVPALGTNELGPYSNRPGPPVRQEPTATTLVGLMPTTGLVRRMLPVDP